MGHFFVPISTAFREKEATFLINSCQAELIVTESQFFKMLLSIQDACPSLQRIVSVSEGSLPNPVKSLKEILGLRQSEWVKLCPRIQIR